MAKGFTVKAKKPQVPSKENEWDYDKAKELVKGKTIVFCLPGRGVSYTYLKSFVQLCFDMHKNILSQEDKRQLPFLLPFLLLYRNPTLLFF